MYSRIWVCVACRQTHVCAHAPAAQRRICCCGACVRSIDGAQINRRRATTASADHVGCAPTSTTINGGFIKQADGSRWANRRATDVGIVRGNLKHDGDNSVWTSGNAVLNGEQRQDKTFAAAA